MRKTNRLVVDVNWSGVVGGYTNRYALMSWADFHIVMIQRAAQAALYNPPNSPNWREPPKPRVAVVFQETSEVYR